MYFGDCDFDKTMNISSMEGFDIDCNAAQIASIIAIISGVPVDKKWIDPIGDNLHTYMRNLKDISIKDLSKETVEVARKS